jgi:hypothetical protein
MSGEVHIVSVNIGALTNARRNFMKSPSDAHGGGITLLSAFVNQGGTTSSALRLVTTGTAGTSASGTITTTPIGGAGTAFAVNTPKVFTIPAANAFLDAGVWLAIKEANVQACNAVTIVQVQYTMGR